MGEFEYTRVKYIDNTGYQRSLKKTLAGKHLDSRCTQVFSVTSSYSRLIVYLLSVYRGLARFFRFTYGHISWKSRTNYYCTNLINLVLINLYVENSGVISD